MKRERQGTRDRAVRRSLIHRNPLKRRRGPRQSRSIPLHVSIENRRLKGLNVNISSRFKHATITLPTLMNFSDKYEETINYINLIREFTSNQHLPNSYKLRTVLLNRLENISTSAALVLTAELSRWDDSCKSKLTPQIENWNHDILIKFHQLGFFDLFHGSPDFLKLENSSTTNTNIVPYIKGRCGDHKKTQKLKEHLIEIIGKSIPKWTFLSSGISEAITNVSHHAYPESDKYQEKDKFWYLTGSFNHKTKELKIVFYDQGVTIPKSLPASKIWEQVLSALSKLPFVDRKKDEMMLKAAVELKRTSTNDTDRGKGLLDLLEFVKQRQSGYISIISAKGLYKYSRENGQEYVKTERFKEPLLGTLIIWKATLDMNQELTE